MGRCVIVRRKEDVSKFLRVEHCERCVVSGGKYCRRIWRDNVDKFIIVMCTGSVE